MYEYECTIRRVVDGDTVDVDVSLGFGVWRCSERIRLYGVDCPECRTRDATEKAAGLLAKEFVKEALHVGGTYTLQTKEKGKFGRYLGTIFITKKTSVNDSLIKENLAVAYHGQSKTEIKKAHKANYKILKTKGLI